MESPDDTTKHEYLYDANGNLTADYNKQIGAVHYNYLNLPTLVDLGDDNYIEYLYDAAGIKLKQKVYKNGDLQKETDYVGNFLYENSSLKFIITDEGRLLNREEGTGYDYEYFIKDHLGNNRVVLKDSLGFASVQQEDHYYPFGMTLGGQSWHNPLQKALNKYMYNGKELQDDLGLDWHDYGARFYDAQLGRWFCPDPLEQFHSGYVYAGNNPVNMIDPSGMFSYYLNGEYIGERGGDNNEGDDGGDKDNGGNPDPPVKSFTQQLIDSWKSFWMGASKEEWEKNPAQASKKSKTSAENVADAIVVIQDVNGVLYAVIPFSSFAELGASEGGTATASAAAFVLIDIGTAGKGGSTVKGFKSMSAFQRYYGIAGKGKAWHHIVEQHAYNIAQFGEEAIHNLHNMIKLPHGKGTIHQALTNHYNSYIPGTTIKVRDMVKRLSFKEQYEYGIAKLIEYGTDAKELWK